MNNTDKDIDSRKVYTDIGDYTEVKDSLNMKKSVKLISVILIAVQIFMFCGSCYAEDESEFTTFKTEFTSLFSEITAKEWLQSSESRALITVCMIIDLGVHLDPFYLGIFDVDSATFNTSYVGITDYNSIVVYLDDDIHQYIIYYDVFGSASYLMFDDIDSYMIPYLFEAICLEYYKNDADAIIDVAINLLEYTSQGNSEYYSPPSTGTASALEKAKSYLRTSAFSYTGLVEQLEYSGFSNYEATYAANNCGADWNEQALRKAKSYLSTSAFSYKGLIDQLEYSGFTASQAKYGADRCGANWNEQAVKKAKSYLQSSSNWTKSRLKSQLEYSGFTSSEASYGVNNCGKSW